VGGLEVGFAVGDAAVVSLSWKQKNKIKNQKNKKQNINKKCEFLVLFLLHDKKYRTLNSKTKSLRESSYSAPKISGPVINIPQIYFFGRNKGCWTSPRTYSRGHNYAKPSRAQQTTHPLSLSHTHTQTQPNLSPAKRLACIKNQHIRFFGNMLHSSLRFQYS
jgi:hypothetical protein